MKKFNMNSILILFNIILYYNILLSTGDIINRNILYKNYVDSYWNLNQKNLKVSSFSTFFAYIGLDGESNILSSGNGLAIRDKKDVVIRGKSDAVKSNFVALESTPDTPYMLASISKTFTFTALTILYDQKKFNLDDDVSDYLGWTLRNPNYPTIPITFRMFYTHRTSIRSLPVGSTLRMYGPVGANVWDGTVPADGIKTCPNVQLEDFFDDWIRGISDSKIGGIRWFRTAADAFLPKNIKPGSKEVYSNLAAAFVGVLVEKISKMPFIEFTQKYIFDKLELSSASWNYELGKSAWPYTTLKSKPYFATGGPYCFLDYPDGQLHISANDLAKFDLAIMQFGKSSTSDERLYSEETGKMALGCQDYIFPNSDCYWGLGWGLEYVNSGYLGFLGKNAGYCYKIPNSKREVCRIPMHDGSETGVATISVINVKAGNVLGVLTNGEKDPITILKAIYAKGVSLI